MATMHTKGLQILLQKEGTSATALVPTAISSAAPATVTVANSLADGDLIYCDNTGFTELDGHFFTVENVTGADFDLTGSDTSATSDTLAASPSISAYEMTDMQLICASAISIDANVPGNISVATFCNLNASIPSQITDPGNVTLNLFNDPTHAGFIELDKAYSDGATRVFSVVFPSSTGVLAQYVIVSGLTFSDVPLDGAAAWQATLALSAPLDFIY